ncbi:MAG: Ni/Fe hydrogenase subunit alpha [Chloroflexaceae bacterium]|jgi:NAD-reducing hydrogenase large subunit|nr:Ni/Fe hydrogenase subunit alpha [Chloroflexaceae bacterium]
MPQMIMIDPVSRIEGHAKITIHLDDAGQVEQARFHVTEFRGFEQFCVGRPFWEMPGITARICGICPISHVLASARAGDAILAADVPPAAEKLRRLMNMGQLVQSHALSFFHLSAPDLLLGMDSDPATRNVFGLMAAEPELARGGIRLRQLGQEIIEYLGGRKIHPSWAVPGGVRSPLSREHATALQERLPEALQTTHQALALFKGLIERFSAEVASFGNVPSLFLGMVGPDGRWEHHGEKLRIVDETGSVLRDQLDGARYREFISEATEAWTYLKSPFYTPLGRQQGAYRVGPLARLNVCNYMGTPAAEAELAEFRQRAGAPALSSFYYHYARLIEILACLERIEQLLEDDDLFSNRLRAEAGVNQYIGVGVSEAPRGTLFHDYTVDANGLIQAVNFIIATGQNNPAMNQAVTQVAQRFVHGPTIPEGALNRMEASIRAFDPCLSCSTHASGHLLLDVRLLDAAGNLLDHVAR